MAAPVVDRAILAVVQQGPPSSGLTPRPPHLGPPDELDPVYPRRLGGFHSAGASSAALSFHPAPAGTTHAAGVSSALAPPRVQLLFFLLARLLSVR